MKSIAILWNAMNPFFEEAINDISKFVVIESLEYVEFKDYRQFIKDIYALDTGTGKPGYSDYKADIVIHDKLGNVFEKIKDAITSL